MGDMRDSAEGRLTEEQAKQQANEATAVLAEIVEEEYGCSMSDATLFKMRDSLTVLILSVLAAAQPKEESRG